MYYVMLCIYLLFISLDFSISKYGMHWFKMATPWSGHQTGDNVPRLLTTDWDVFTLYCNSELCLFSHYSDCWILTSPVDKFWIKTCEVSWSRTPHIFHYCLTDFDRWNYNFYQWMLEQDLLSLEKLLFSFSFGHFCDLSSTKHCICSWNQTPTDHR